MRDKPVVSSPVAAVAAAAAVAAVAAAAAVAATGAAAPPPPPSVCTRSTRSRAPVARLPPGELFRERKIMMVGPVNLNVPIGMEQKRKRDHAARRTPAASPPRLRCDGINWRYCTKVTKGTQGNKNSCVYKEYESCVVVVGNRAAPLGTAIETRQTARQLIIGSRRWTPAVRPMPQTAATARSIPTRTRRTPWRPLLFG